VLSANKKKFSRNDIFVEPYGRDIRIQVVDEAAAKRCVSAKRTLTDVIIFKTNLARTLSVRSNFADRLNSSVRPCIYQTCI
jgi:hypothetical protein